MMCPACRSEDIRVGWPEASMPMEVIHGNYAERNGLLVPLTCKNKKCGHKWTMRYLPSPTEGEWMDREAKA